MRSLIFAVMMILAASCAFALELPDSVNEWQCVNEHVTSLVPDATGESLGRVVYRDYVREAPNGLVQVIMTDGEGTGNLYVPEKLNDSKGVLPTDSRYQLLNVAGHKSILESYPFMPLALAVSVGDNVILTIESGSLNENEIVSFAEEILSRWRTTK